MVEKTMKEAVSETNYQKWDRGQPMSKEPEPVIPQPEPPKVDKLLTLDKFKMMDVVSVPGGRRKVIRNKEGVVFIGFDMEIRMKDNSIVTGWMPASDFYKFKREVSRNRRVSFDNLEM